MAETRFECCVSETAQLQDYFVDSAIAQGKLVSVLDRFKPNIEPIWLVYPQTRHLTPTVRVPPPMEAEPVGAHHIRTNSSTHPILGDELRSLRRLQREPEPKSPFVFTSERGTPFTTAGFERAGACGIDGH